MERSFFLSHKFFYDVIMELTTIIIFFKHVNYNMYESRLIFVLRLIQNTNLGVTDYFKFVLFLILLFISTYLK